MPSITWGCLPIWRRVGSILMDQDSLTRVAAEHDNVRLALTWFDEHGEIDALLQLSSLLYGLWVGRGLYREGLHWVDRAVEQSSYKASAALVRALNGAGILAIFEGDNARGKTSLAKAEALARELGDPSLIGETLAYSAFLTYRRREFARAEELLDEARRLLGRQANNAPSVSPVLTLGGVVPFLTLGDLALAQGQVERAATHYAEAIERFREAGSEWGWRDMQAGLAATRYLKGDLPGAAALYVESMQQSRRCNSGRSWSARCSAWLASRWQPGSLKLERDCSGPPRVSLLASAQPCSSGTIPSMTVCLRRCAWPSVRIGSPWYGKRSRP